MNNRKLSYGEFNDYVDSVCRYLLSFELKRGDTLCVVLKNSIEFILFMFASLRLGIIFCPFPNMLTGWEIRRDLEFYDPDLLIVEAEKRGEFKDDPPCRFITLEPGVFFRDLQKKGTAVQPQPVSEADTACIYYTGGGKSDPRGILYTFGNIVSLIRSITRGFRFEKDSVHLLVLPLAHTAALNYTLLPVFFAGGSLTLTESFWSIRDRFWNLIRKHRVSYVQVVPSVLQMLLTQRPDSKERCDLRYIGCGSAPLDPNLQYRFEKEFNLPVANLYGLSETGPTHVDLPTEENWKRGGIGKPLDVNKIVIMNTQGGEQVRGEEGQIAVKGNNVFPGYAIHSELTAQFFRNGYFLTGDIGYMEDDNTCYFLRRKKKIIIKGGFNIYPGEIDEVLAGHPDVVRSETSGKEDLFLGEGIESRVVIKSHSNLSEQELRKFCASFLSFLKVPDTIILSPEHSG